MDNTTKPSDISPLYIQDEMKSSYLDYAMSVIVGRALPDFRDGLKPVHRRILYSMYNLNNTYSRPYMKSARIVGDVIGKYHPHGDSAVYNSLVRLAQDFSMRYTLVDGQGNFGSIDGDNAAAMRYTEVRMQKMADELLFDLEKDTVLWGPNYDDSLIEPKVLPTKIPNLLINGSTGIAVGMATNIPPHNLTEVMSALIAMIDSPEISLSELCSIVTGPDFPTGATILGGQGVKEAYLTGKGIIQIRAKAEIEVHEKNDREYIVITELPYQVLKSSLIEKIASLVHEKEITGISDIRDESNHLGMRVVIDIKKGESASVILNRLYKQTQMQSSYGIIFLGIIQNRPKVLNLKEMLEVFIEHRREIVVKRTIFDLKKAEDKAHILEGLKLAVENIDAVIELIKKSNSPTEAKEKLIGEYSLSDKQSQAILDMKLQKITNLETNKIIEEYNEVMDLIKELKSILSSKERINSIIKNEFVEIKEKYGDERKTEIQANNEEIVLEDLIQDEPVIVSITKKGYIKRLSVDTYKSQKRGGKGVKGGEVLEDDYYTKIFNTNTHATIMFFTNKGTVFSLKVYNIPESSRVSKGRNIINLINLPPGEDVKEIITLDQDKTNKFLIMATSEGIVKKSDLIEYKNIKLNGLKAIRVVEGDEVVAVRIIRPGDDVILCSSSGKVIRFSEEDCRPLGRVSQGVKGIGLEENEKVIGMEIIEKNQNVEILSVTEKGYGKRTISSEYRQQTRGGKGILTSKQTDKTGDIVQVVSITENVDLMIITDKGQVIRINVDEISVLGRNTQGVKLITVKENEKVVAVEKLAVEVEDSSSLEEDNS